MNYDNRPIEWNGMSAERICAISILEKLEGMNQNSADWNSLEDDITAELIKLTNKYLNFVRNKLSKIA